jgi:hypothetical protein
MKNENEAGDRLKPYRRNLIDVTRNFDCREQELSLSGQKRTIYSRKITFDENDNPQLTTMELEKSPLPNGVHTLAQPTEESEIQGEYSFMEINTPTLPVKVHKNPKI